ncbi:MAG: MAPEG family protein [Polyangiales bacterium]
MMVPIVALYAPLNAVLNIALAGNVVRHRARGLSDSDKDLQLAIRIHGNNAEFVPLALLMMLLAELSGGASFWLHVAGGLLLVARVAHVLGMPLKAPNPLRSFGVAGTWGMIVALSLYCLVLRAR